MAQSRKRKCEEMEVSELDVSNAATIHGVFVVEVSPVKCGRRNPDVKYFEGRMTDGKKTVSVISFEPRLRTEVENARKSSEGVALTNCLVQRTKQPGAELEVKATAHTSVVKSPRKFELAEDVEYTAVASSELRSLEEIDGLAVNQRVTVTGKVVSVKPAVRPSNSGGTTPGSMLFSREYSFGRILSREQR